MHGTPLRVGWEPAVVGLGLLALTLGAVCAVAALLHGGWFVEPEGRLMDALRFEVGSGIFFLTMAVLVPLAGFTDTGRQRWVTALVLMGVYFLGIETIQAIRGLDPRFTRAGTTVDQAAGAIFGVTALLLVLLTAVLAARFFRSDTMADRPDIRTAIRYGFAGIAFSFGAGLAMSALSGRAVGPAGSLMPVHAAGLHGIQAVPLLALMARARGVGPGRRNALVHLAGVGWLLLCAGLLAQAYAGRTPVEISAWNVIAAAGVIGVLGAFAIAVASHPPNARGILPVTSAWRRPWGRP
jgi:hypothetical protein